MNRLLGTAGLIFMLLLAADTAWADSMRCDGHVIQGGGLDGPTQYEVLQKCGEPTYSQGDRWVYQREGEPTYILIFDANGVLAEVQEQR